VPDFIGFACREVASRIRGAVAGVPFEVFHKYSTDIIRTGVFGKTDSLHKEELVFKANNLVSSLVEKVRNCAVCGIEKGIRHSLRLSV